MDPIDVTENMHIFFTVDSSGHSMQYHANVAEIAWDARTKEEIAIIKRFPRYLYEMRKTDIFTGDHISIDEYKTKAWYTSNRVCRGAIRRVFALLKKIFTNAGFVCLSTTKSDEYDIILLPPLFEYSIYFGLFDLYYENYETLPWNETTVNIFPAMVKEGWPNEAIDFIYNQLVKHHTLH